MFGKKKEKVLDEYEVKAVELMDAVGVPNKSRKGLGSIRKYFKLAAEEIFDNEEAIAYVLVANQSNKGLGSVLILTNKRILGINDIGLMKTAESIPLKQIVSIENSKYELAIKTASKDFLYKDISGSNLKDFSKVVKQHLMELC
jgi:hypothetical protein